MAFDAHKNFAYSTVLTAPSPATSGTTLVVQSGDGAKFPTPPFNAVVWPAGTQPLTTNSEIVRVTNISTDTLTITRGATSGGGLNGEPNNQNRSIIVGDQIDASMTVKIITDIEADLYNAHKFYAYRANTYTPSTTSAIVFDTKVFDTSTEYTVADGKFTATLAGFYQFEASLSLSVGSGSHYYVMLYKNGSELLRLAENTAGATTSFIYGGSGLVQLAVADYVQVYIAPPGATTVNTGANFSFFMGYLVSQT